MESEEDQIVDHTYHWNHPLKNQLKEGLSKLWKTDSISFDSLDGTTPNKVPNSTPPEPTCPYERVHGQLYLEQRQRRMRGPSTIPYKLNPIVHLLPNKFRSALQWKHQGKLQPMDDVMKRYFRAVSILEYEHDHGSIIDDQFEVSMVGNSCWVPAEKKKFFLALERCGKNPEEIVKRVGPTKNIAEVMDYLKLLETLSKSIKLSNIKSLTAREISPIFIAQEEHMATLIQDKLQVESYGKHLQYLNRPENDLFEIWNMSSLTRLFAGINDMTILSSSTINFHELVKQFISDIIIDLHTDLLKSTDKTVTKDLINTIIERRRKKINPDKRLRKLNSVMAIDKCYQFQDQLTYNYTISKIAKKRRALPISDFPEECDVEDEDYYNEEEDGEEDIEGNIEDEIDTTDESESEDDMLKPIDDSDLLRGGRKFHQYVAKDDYSQLHLDLSLQKNVLEGNGKAIDINNTSEENEDEIIQELHQIEQEEAEELELQKLDKLHEKELSDHLGFYDESSILNRENSVLNKEDNEEEGPSKKRRLQ